MDRSLHPEGPMVVDRAGHFPVTWRIEGERYLSRLARPEIRRERSLFDPAGFQFHHQIVFCSTSVGHGKGDRLSRSTVIDAEVMVNSVSVTTTFLSGAVATNERSRAGGSSACDGSRCDEQAEDQPQCALETRLPGEASYGASPLASKTGMSVFRGRYGGEAQTERQ